MESVRQHFTWPRNGFLFWQFFPCLLLIVFGKAKDQELVVVPNDLCYLCAALLSVPQCSSLFFFGAWPPPSAVYFITCGQLPTKVGNKNGSKWKSLANQRVLAAACLQIICYIYVERQLGTESYNIPCQHREVLRDNKKLQRRKKYPQWYFICTDCLKLYTKYSSWNICNYNKIVYIFDCFYRSIFFYHIVIIPRISIYLFFSLYQKSLSKQTLKLWEPKQKIAKWVEKQGPSTKAEMFGSWKMIHHLARTSFLPFFLFDVLFLALCSLAYPLRWDATVARFHTHIQAFSSDESSAISLCVCSGVARLCLCFLRGAGFLHLPLSLFFLLYFPIFPTLSLQWLK